jgi:hypothetical protein
MLGDFTLRDQYLTTPAKSPPAADRVDVHSQAARRLQEWSSNREMAALAGRREYDKRISGRHDGSTFTPAAGDDHPRAGRAERRRRRPCPAAGLRGTGESNVRNRGRVLA